MPALQGVNFELAVDKLTITSTANIKGNLVYTSDECGCQLPFTEDENVNGCFLSPLAGES